MINTRLMSKTDFSRQGFMNQFIFVNHRKKILRGFIVANERATCKIRVNLSHYSGDFLGITLTLQRKRWLRGKNELKPFAIPATVGQYQKLPVQILLGARQGLKNQPRYKISDDLRVENHKNVLIYIG